MIITLTEAKAHGLPRYFTGKPCKRGHIAPRNPHNATCTVCISEDAKARWRETPELRERACVQRKALRERHPDRNAGYVRRYRLANPDKCQAMIRDWQTRNPGKVRMQDKRAKLMRRARQAGAEGRHTLEDIARITKEQGDKCCYCRKRRKLTVDHIKALAKGGSNWPHNIQMACLPCNSSKKDRDPVEFAQTMGRLI